MSESGSPFKNETLLHDVDKPDGLMEQLGLPPKMIRFVREHKAMVWTVTILVITAVVTVSLYSSYRTYRINKAASALDLAIQAPENNEAQLKEVIAEYGSEAVATWAKVELVKRYNQAEEFDKELQLLTEMDTELSDNAVLKPLVTSKIAAVYERTEQYEKALGMYTVLAASPGFEAESQLAMGRIYESMGNADQAIAMYVKYLEGTSEEAALTGQQDPARMVVESKLRQLRKS